MKTQIRKVLLVIEQCNPEWASVPLIGYNYYNEIRKLVHVTLVTHERNRENLESIHPGEDIVYISESKLVKKYYKIAEKISKVGNRTIWPLYHTLQYPIYGEFNNLVYERFRNSVLNGDYDIVHAITPMMPRYPVKLIKVCHNIPFIIGPVNGGVPFPKGFQNIANQEFSYFNFIRLVGRFIIPGYRETYKKAAYILAGSTFTFDLIRDLFSIENDKIELFYENGVQSSFVRHDEEFLDFTARDKDTINLLFVGRLVPYKGADFLIEAISKLRKSVLEKIVLTIVGDGSERYSLELQVKNLNLEDKVIFAGWVKQKDTFRYYADSDVFCFPSIREFGGAVVLEAMSSGLPCIVVNNGGIGEYVTDETGFRIDPISKEYIIESLQKSIDKLVSDTSLRREMGLNALQRVKEFTWPKKAEEIADIYESVLQSRNP
jgi:glycosyltransferase involved in cell wall biosynthesis